MPHPLAVQRIWEIFGKARVDLFASKYNSHCPIFFYQKHRCPGPRMAQPSALCFDPVALLPQILRRVRNNGTSWFYQPPLEEPTVGVRVIPAAKSSSMADPLETGPSLSSGTARYGIHGLSYGPCMCGCSTGAFRSPRACPKHYGRS